MRRIQDILLNNNIELEEEKEMYYRSEGDIFTAVDGSAKLSEGTEYDFFTYYNTLEIKKWKKYTYAETIYLVVEAKGTFNLELYGYKVKGDRFQKEYGGRFSFDSTKKEKIVIPYPRLMESDLVSFGINAEKDTYVYSTYFAADVDEKKCSKPGIVVTSSACSEDNIIKENIEVINEYIFNDDNLKNAFRVVVSDTEDLLGDIDFPGVIIQKDKKLKVDSNITNILYIDEHAKVFGHGLKRLYSFLSVIKAEYKDIMICGDLFEEMRPGSKLDIVLNDEKDSTDISKSGKNYILSYSDYNDNDEFLASRSNFKNLGTGVFCCKSNKTREFEPEKVFDVYRDVLFLNGMSCTVRGIKSKIGSEVNRYGGAVELTTLHNILLGTPIEIEVTRHMYYRSERLIENDGETGSSLADYTYYDFFTYFNSLSLEKWKKFTYADNFYLILDIEGEFELELFGHFKNKTGYQKEWLGKENYDIPDRERLVIQFPKGIQSTLVAFGINAKKDVKIYSAKYASNVPEDKIRTPLISMVTTTFKKESYVKKNIELLTEHLLNDDQYKDNFVWNIIDNGRTLEEGWILEDKIRIIPNKNVGGAGGFSKGMMESLKQEPFPTHILLMDDDVVFMPESFKRLCNLLSIVREEYKERFISGAMLKMGQPNIQHEDTGKLNEQGYHEAVKPNYDLNLWDHIIDNEVLHEDVPNQYAAWWFCCIPTSVASLENLPLPVFVRGDDVEYSLRNNAEFITMNGICIWHEGFEGKFSASLEYYQVNRNELAVRALHPELSAVDCIGHIKMIFWEEMYKFNYKGATLLLDAVDDYMKGPEFFKKLDGEKSMKKKKLKDNQPKPLTPEIKAQIDFDSLYENPPIEGKIKLLYDYSCNGQMRIPEMLLRKKTGIIPYGWGYFPSKMVLADTIIAVDPTNETYVVYKRDRKKFNRIKARYEKLMAKYNAEHKNIEKAYQDSLNEITGEAFWDGYLA